MAKHEELEQKITFSDSEIDKTLKDALISSRDKVICQVAMRIASRIINESTKQNTDCKIT